MAIFQRTLTAAVAAAALTGVFTASAWAQAEPQLPATPVTAAAGTAAGHPAHRGQPADFAQFHAERNERLKTILQLQPQQEAAWSSMSKPPRLHHGLSAKHLAQTCAR